MSFDTVLTSVVGDVCATAAPLTSARATATTMPASAAVALAIIGRIGTAGGNGHSIEFAGEAIAALSMEGRMTVCNMAIEGGARAGLIAPDDKTFAYVQGRPHAPKGAAWEAAPQPPTFLSADALVSCAGHVLLESRTPLAQVAAGFLGNRDGDGEGEGNGNPMIYFAVSMVLELVFGILASIITMWFSRHREFHADAGSAKLVGREKMIAALQRLKTSYEPQEASSMMAFCINGKSKSLSELFMSHPPLDKRIAALRNGEYLK